MTPEEVKQYFVTWRRAMKELGYSENYHKQWETRGYIPMRAQHRIFKATNGALVPNAVRSGMEEESDYKVAQRLREINHLMDELKKKILDLF